MPLEPLVLLVQLVVHLVVVVVTEPPPLPHQLLSPDPLDPPDQLAILVLKVMLEHPVTMVVQVVMAHPGKDGYPGKCYDFNQFDQHFIYFSRTL